MFSTSPEYLEALYQLYTLRSPELLPEWRSWFDAHYPLDDVTCGQEYDNRAAMSQFVRQYGHLFAKLDPLGLATPPIPKVLLAQWHAYQNLPDFARMAYPYTGTRAYEFMHLEDPEVIAWWAQLVECDERAFTPEQRKEFWRNVVCAVNIESFLKKRFASVKRFGLDGGEALLVGLHQLVRTYSPWGLDEVVVAMAHRGRLNVMLNFLEMPIAEFMGFFKHYSAPEGRDVDVSGDVKYHLGYRQRVQRDNRDIALRLMANPSHLESVNAVAMGLTFALQRQHGGVESVLPLVIHGDAAFVGQGVVAECLNMSGLKGYDVGGVIHVIINNQIGFTTNPQDGRSSRYASDMAKGWQIPIIHVNADDVEAVAKAFDYAARYRHTFHKDVLIDFVCYRRLGHNEIDEPAYTQPLMYKAIQAHPHVASLYQNQLIAEGVLLAEEAQFAEQDLVQQYEAALESALPLRLTQAETQPLLLRPLNSQGLLALVEELTTIPSGFHLHPKLERQIKEKLEAVLQENVIDWAWAESLAIASLLEDGATVRLAGQDAARGTFSQRHAQWIDYDSAGTHVPLQAWGADRFMIVESFLSEFAAMGFEYGFSLHHAPQLVMWEAQFGDFFNGAQIIIDQYLASGYAKWQQTPALVLLLPHGMEGQGPEHSSGRIERFLQLCAHENMTVANCTSPANYFHILRQQVSRQPRKPLVLFTPKSLLRHPEVLSPLEDFCAQSVFSPVIVHEPKVKAERVRRLILCSGKIVYDLLQRQREQKLDDVVIASLEQLYPFPHEELKALLARFSKAEVLWCQEEPENMGAWSHMDRQLESLLKARKLKQTWPWVVARQASSVPATGYAEVHQREQEDIINRAFARA